MSFASVSLIWTLSACWECGDSGAQMRTSAECINVLFCLFVCPRSNTEATGGATEEEGVSVEDSDVKDDDDHDDATGRE